METFDQFVEAFNEYTREFENWWTKEGINLDGRKLAWEAWKKGRERLYEEMPPALTR